MSDLTEAAQARRDRLLFAEMDKRLDLLLANMHGGENPNDSYHKVSANPRSMGYLRFLLRHYSKSKTPWEDCYRDNFRRVGPKAKGLCGVLKDIIRQRADWRHGAPRGPHPGHPDTGSPGVAIGEADKWASPAWGGHHHLSEQRSPCLDAALRAEFGEIDEADFKDAVDVWLALREKLPTDREVHRVILGLDEAPELVLEVV